MTLFAVCALLYFVPTVIANCRSHKHTMAIVMLNIFLGWTLLGWVGALVWSCLPCKREGLSSLRNWEQTTWSEKMAGK